MVMMIMNYVIEPNSRSPAAVPSKTTWRSFWKERHETRRIKKKMAAAATTKGLLGLSSLFESSFPPFTRPPAKETMILGLD